MEMYRNTPSMRLGMPPATFNIILINVIVWLTEVLVPGFTGRLLRAIGLHYVGSELFNPIQIVTYAFAHDPGNIMHILFNMFTLWMFGRTLETVWGTKRFVLYYMVCAVGAALVQEGVWALTVRSDYISSVAALNHITVAKAEALVREAIAHGNPDVQQGMMALKNAMMTIGASGAVFGLLLAFAFVFPNVPLYLFFIPVPVKAKYMVAGYAVLELFLGVGGRMDNVAHYAHLGGMLFGLALLLYWKKHGRLTR